MQVGYVPLEGQQGQGSGGAGGRCYFPQVSHPTVSSRTLHTLVKRWSLAPLPLNLGGFVPIRKWQKRLCMTLGLRQRRCPNCWLEACCWSPEAVCAGRKPKLLMTRDHMPGLDYVKSRDVQTASCSSSSSHHWTKTIGQNLSQSPSQAHPRTLTHRHMRSYQVICFSHSVLGCSTTQQ